MDDASGVEAQVQRTFEDPKIDRFLESFLAGGFSCIVWACLNPIQSSLSPLRAVAGREYDP